MTSFQLLKGLTGIDSEFLVRVEQRTDKQKEMKSHRGIHRPFLLAALIALLLMLVGCGIVYVLHLQDLKIGEQTVPQTQYDDSSNQIGELLIFYNGYIGNIVGMKNGITDDGKSYHMYLCEDNVLVDFDSEPNGLGEYRYHIFRFANDGDPVFSNPKEQSIVRLKKCADGTWWRTSSTEHYAEFDTEISEAEAMEILNSYKPVELETRPLTQFEDP